MSGHYPWPPPSKTAKIRTFDTGATRDTAEGKYCYEGFLSPLVLQRFGAYMHKHRLQTDGSLRAADNWQKGIPRQAYMDSLLRHVMDVWLEHDGFPSRDGLEDALCAIIFNAQGYLHEVLLGRGKEAAHAHPGGASAARPGRRGHRAGAVGRARAARSRA